MGKEKSGTKETKKLLEEIISSIIKAKEKTNLFLEKIHFNFIFQQVHAHDEKMYLSTNTGWTFTSLFL